MNRSMLAQLGALGFAVAQRGRGAAVAALVAVILLAGAAYAVSSHIGQPTAGEPVAAHFDIATHGRTLNLAQTFDGVTVTVERAYADVNRIVVDYTIALPPTLADGHGGVGADLILADRAGRRYLSQFGMGQPTAEARASRMVMSFDAAGLPPGTREMEFTLTIPKVSVAQIDRVQPAVAPVQPSVTGPQARPVGGTEERIEGPWQFAFTIPVLSARVAEVNQTVSAGGIPVTLERVVVSPSEARVYFRFPTTGYSRPENWTPVTHLLVGDWSSRMGEGIPNGSGALNNGTYSYSFLAGLHDRQGTWTFTIDELIGFEVVDSAAYDRTQPPPQTRITGPWAFTFVVP